MGTRKHNIIVITLSAALALFIFFQRKNHHTACYESRVYTIVSGWGYDILVNGNLFIHQESVPALEGNRPFANKVQAMEAARLLISKLKRGQSPAFSRSEIERICLLE